MRKHTILLGAIFFLLLGFLGWFYLGGALSATAHIQTAPASSQPETTAAIQGVLASGAAPQAFDVLPPEDLSDCTLVDVTIDLQNRGLFDAEWLDIRAEAVEGDIAVYSLTGEGAAVAARSAGQVNLKLITTARPDAARRFVIQYYVYGMKRTVVVR